RRERGRHHGALRLGNSLDVRSLQHRRRNRPRPSCRKTQWHAYGTPGGCREPEGFAKFKRRAGPSSNGRTPDFGSGNGGSSPPGPIPIKKKKRAGWPDPRPRWVLPASTLRLGLVGLRLLRLLDLAIGRALGLLRLGLGQAEAVECLAEALAALQAVENRLGRDGGVLSAEVLGEHV